MPTRKSNNDSLQAHDIYLRKCKDLGACPAELRDIFKLVIGIQDLKSDRFGGYEATKSDQSLSPFTPKQQYERELKFEADELSIACSDSRRADDNEEKWVQTLGPIVFYRFDRELEEKYARDRHHHCFICRKHYPVGSRPLINRTSQRSIARRLEKWSEDREQGLWECTSTEHFNLPNFDNVSQLAYPEFENEQKKIPDLTIGLHTYDLNQWADSQCLMLLNNDRVKLFDQKLLRKLEDEGYLMPPFIRPGSHGRSVGDISLTFPFAFWEAKREGGGYDHQTAEKQNAIKVKMMLSWQDEIGKRADIPWMPLVWYFISVGSKWEVHACHFQQNSNASDGRISVLMKLWSGDSADIDNALQLLYIIDIIALWGEHKYKPFAGACIHRFKARMEKIRPPRLEKTLLAAQLEISSDTFSWLFPEPEDHRGIRWGGKFRRKHQKLLSEIRSRPESPQSRQLLQGIENISRSSHEKDYIIPERDFFIWLLDRDRHGGDLLIVRIDDEGSILPPLVIFDSACWKRRGFKRVLKDEQARRPAGILTEFRTRRDGTSYIESCVAERCGYFREPQTQFCAIIPLEPGAYRLQLEADGDEVAPFERIESLLRLPQLIVKAERANDKWCKCKAPYNKYSPSMILCDNLKCPIGWYHKKCVRLDEDFTADLWLCKRCLRRCQENELSQIEIGDVDEDICEASDARTQRIKTLARIWEEHDWPSPEKVRRLIDRTSWRINIRTNARNTYDTVPGLKSKFGDDPRCWAIVKNIPKVMMAIRPVGREAAQRAKKNARRLTHRKSDCGMSSAVKTSSLTPLTKSGQLTIPQWRNL